MVPATGVIALLVNPNSAVREVETKELNEAARTLGLETRILNAASESEIDAAFAMLAKERSVPLVVSSDNLFTDRPVRLVVLAARHAIPAIYPYRWFAAAGGLMSYGPDLADVYRVVGTYAGRILKGAKPADLPIQQAVKVELVINLKTAKTLGLDDPAQAARPRRRGHRIACLFAAIAHGRLWHEAAVPAAPTNVRS